MLSLRAWIFLAFAMLLGITVAEAICIQGGWVGVAYGLMVCELALMGGGIYGLNRRLFGPLRELTAAAEEVGQGLRERVPEPTQGQEVGQAAAAMNKMVAALSETRSGERLRLFRAQETTRVVLGALPHAVVLVTPGGIAEISNSAAAGFGIAQGMDVHGCAMQWLPELVDKVKQTRAAAVNPALVQLFHEGKELFLRPEAHPVLDAERSLVGITVVLLDVTEKRLVEEARSGLLSAMSHQIKTPMTSIQMSIHLLLEDTRNPLTPRQAELMQAAREEAARLYKLIEEWLASARAQ